MCHIDSDMNGACLIQSLCPRLCQRQPLPQDAAGRGFVLDSAQHNTQQQGNKCASFALAISLALDIGNSTGHQP